MSTLCASCRTKREAARDTDGANGVETVGILHHASLKAHPAAAASVGLCAIGVHGKLVLETDRGDDACDVTHERGVAGVRREEGLQAGGWGRVHRRRRAPRRAPAGRRVGEGASSQA
eukprot:294169-Chlamydomonas_euryale.AAC.4